jgi:uncharacterized protein YbjT (DUF2867 family)
MILVTGATGNVGGAVVEHLLSAGAEVRALSRDPARARLPGAVPVVAGDLTRPETLPAALDGVRAVFLFPVADAVAGFVEAASRAGVQHIVVLSSAAVVMGDDNAIGRWHATVERAVADSGIGWTFVRPGAFMANTLQWGDSVRTEDVVRVPYGESASAPVDEWDIGAVAATALLQPGHQGASYLLTGPEALTVAQQVKVIGSVLGRPIRFEELPPAAARQAMLRFVPAEVVDALFEFAAATVGRPVEVLPTVQQVTGRPARTFAQWVTRHAAAFGG